jgi:hypothetical protein
VTCSSAVRVSFQKQLERDNAECSRQAYHHASRLLQNRLHGDPAHHEIVNQRVLGLRIFRRGFDRGLVVKLVILGYHERGRLSGETRPAYLLNGAPIRELRNMLQRSLFAVHDGLHPSFHIVSSSVAHVDHEKAGRRVRHSISSDGVADLDRRSASSENRTACTLAL